MTTTSPAADPPPLLDPLDHDWRALHISIGGGQAEIDAFVAEVAGPLSRDLMARGAARSWFFIRYWEGGPHVRWRLAGADDGSLTAAADAARRWLAARTPPPTLAAEQFYALAGQPASAVEQHGWHSHGTVVTPRYEREVRRYGGPYAIDAAERMFTVSSELTARLAAAQASSPPTARLSRGLDLIFALVAGAGLGPVAAVTFLRRYAAGWSLVPEAAAVDLPAARAAAEREFASGPDRLVARRQAVATALASGALPDSLPVRWGTAVAAYQQELDALDAAGLLETPPLVVLGSQLHMTANRAGLQIAEEVYLVWLASLAYAAVASAPFHGDPPDEAHAPDRTYHESSKFIPHLRAEQNPDPAAPLVVRRVHPGATAVRLPATDPGALAEVPLATALLQRRSRYGLYTGTLPITTLSRLLHYAVGDTDELSAGSGPTAHRFPVRTYPSAGGRHAVRVLVWPRAVEGVQPALYEHIPNEHCLQRVVPEPDHAALLRTSAYTDPAYDPPLDVGQVPLWLVVVGDLGYLRARYGQRAYRFLHLEAGHATQNLLLVATALGLKTMTIGGFYDDAFAQLLHLDGVDQVPIYLLPVAQRLA